MIRHVGQHVMVVLGGTVSINAAVFLDGSHAQLHRRVILRVHGQRHPSGGSLQGALPLPLVDLGLAGICTMQWYLAPCELRRISPFVMYPLVHAAAQFFLLVQVARLWGRRPDRLQPVYFPMLALLVFICLGDIDTTPRQHRWYRDAVMLLVGLTCLFYGQARRIGLRGIARIHGESVSLWFYLLRRPISAVRQRFGL